MALYQYIKKEPEVKSRRSKKEISFLFSVLGLILVGNALIPIISYQFRYAPRFGKILSPLVYDQKEVLGAFSASAREEDKDYTLISSWFDDFSQTDSGRNSELAGYQISIPKLGIEDSFVHFRGEDLKKTLIHYPGTSLPGDLGNGVIFGHSVLPQFFNPDNYLTIFSTLYKLKKGDEIWINFDGAAYRYLVEDLFEVSPSDLTVLEQRYDGRFLTLITCSPPGTYLRRLIVRTRLVD